MASSLININEATAGELQRLEGIGPKRSAYIVEFRNQVALIRNTFDLAAATGLSIKSAERIASKIDWETGNSRPFGLWPAAILTLACLWLIISGFDQIAREPFIIPQGFYNLSLSLILLGGLSATGDVAISSVRRRPSESSWISVLAASLFIIGFAILTLLAIAALWVEYSPEFLATMRRTIEFSGYCALMLWLVYGPAFCLRYFIDDNRLDQLDASKFIYDLSLVFSPLLPFYSLTSHDDPAWTTEIFSIWCIAVVALGGFELVGGRSAFVSILSEHDQSRFRFAYFNRGRREHGNKVAQVLGWICLGEAVTLASIMAYGIILP